MLLPYCPARLQCIQRRSEYCSRSRSDRSRHCPWYKAQRCSSAFGRYQQRRRWRFRRPIIHTDFQWCEIYHDYGARVDCEHFLMAVGLPSVCDDTVVAIRVTACAPSTFLRGVGKAVENPVKVSPMAGSVVLCLPHQSSRSL